MTKDKDSSYFVEASAAWDRGDIDEARKIFEVGAKLGDPSCQLNLGVFLEVGLGGRQSISDAIKWYRKSFSEDPAGGAALNLADAYRKVNNSSRAVFWYKRAVAAGDGDAALELAKHIAAAERRGYRKRIKELLGRAIRSKIITPESKEKAKEWLAALVSE